MPQQKQNNDQVRAAEYPAHPWGSLAKSCLRLRAGCGLASMALAFLSAVCYTAARFAFWGLTGGVLAKYAMNPLLT
jgi:hypothetical protein